MPLRKLGRVVLIGSCVVVLAGCGGDGTEATTSTTTPISFTADEESFLVAMAPVLADSDLEAATAVRIGHDLCHTLRLLEAAAQSGAAAADAIRLVDLDGLTQTELAAYGAILNVAPYTLCQDVAFLGADVAYWLGF